MTKRNDKNNEFGLESLLALPTVPDSEFSRWDSDKFELDLPQSPRKSSLFSSKLGYRFCRAVVQQPMQPTSTYPKLAGISSKSARELRLQLIAMGFIREHKMNTSARGRASVLLEALPAGIDAVKQYELDGKK